MLPILNTDRYCFGVPREALNLSEWDNIKKEYVYPSKKLNTIYLSGVYVIFSFKHGFLYVGKAKTVRGRLLQHFTPSNGRLGSLYTTIKELNGNITLKDLDESMIIVFPIDNKKERSEFELMLIDMLKPPLNFNNNPLYEYSGEIYDK